MKCATGAGIITDKECYQFSDEKTVAHITMNPYLQYFIGLEDYITKSPFDASMPTRFRKRIPFKMLEEVNDIVISRLKQQKKTSDDTGDRGRGESAGDNEGTLILDATYASQNSRFS